jgi:copper transport protein
VFGKRVAAVGGLVAAAVLGLAAPASAHAQLQSSDPVAATVLERSPGQVTLRFDEPVELSFGAVRVYDTGSRRVDHGRATHPGGDHHAVRVAVPTDLATGGYVVSWRVISADSHPVHGAFVFRIGAGGASNTELRAEAARLLAATGSSRLSGRLMAAGRFVGLAALLVVVGATVLVVVIWPEGAAIRRVQLLVAVTAGALALATVGILLLDGPYAGGLPLADGLRPSVLTAVAHTRFGQMALLRLALAAVAVASGLRHRLALIVAGGLVASLSAAGHAAVGSHVVAAVLSDAVHVGAASIWVGGLAVLAVLAIPGPDRGEVLPVATRFSGWAVGAVMALVATGGLAAWRQVGSLAALTGTSYGRLLVAKTVAFVALVGLGASSRRGLRAGTEAAASSTAGTVSSGPGAVAARPAAGARLRVTVAAELAVAVIVVALTTALSDAVPARTALARPYSAEVHAGAAVLVDVVVDPAKVGPVAVHVYTLTADGAQFDAPHVTASLSLPGGPAIDVGLVRIGTGHFATYALEVPTRGTWELSIRIDLSPTDQLVAQPVHVPIR